MVLGVWPSVSMFLNLIAFLGILYLISSFMVIFTSFINDICCNVCLSLVSIFGVPFFFPHLVMSPRLFLPVTSLKHMCLSPSRHCYLTSCLILIVSCSPCVVFRFASPVSSVRFVSAVFFPPSLPSVYLCPQSPSDPCCIVRSYCVVLYFLQLPCFHVL